MTSLSGEVLFTYVRHFCEDKIVIQSKYMYSGGGSAPPQAPIIFKLNFIFKNIKYYNANVRSPLRDVRKISYLVHRREHLICMR